MKAKATLVYPSIHHLSTSFLDNIDTDIKDHYADPIASNHYEYSKVDNTPSSGALKNRKGNSGARSAATFKNFADSTRDTFTDTSPELAIRGNFELYNEMKRLSGDKVNITWAFGGWSQTHSFSPDFNHRLAGEPSHVETDAGSDWKITLPLDSFVDASGAFENDNEITFHAINPLVTQVLREGSGEFVHWVPIETDTFYVANKGSNTNVNYPNISFNVLWKDPASSDPLNPDFFRVIFKHDGIFLDDHHLDKNIHRGFLSGN